MLSSHYQHPLVLISILVAILASYIALTLGSRVNQQGAGGAFWWIVGGAFAMGTGIWAMHFIGMLAFRLPIPVGYDLGITLGSWLIPILASALALVQMRLRAPSVSRLLACALLLAAGIGAMHYIGMSAMRMEPAIVYDPAWVAASVVFAVVAGVIALFVGRILRDRTTRIWIPRAAASILLGGTIAGTHYTGMLAANFPLGSVCLAAGSGFSQDGLAIVVSIATFSVLAIALLTSIFDARLESRTQMLALTRDIAEERQRLLEGERAARADAERLGALKDEFLATLSHELRTPLNSVLGWAQLLRLQITDQAAQNGLATIERNARLQAQLIDDLLDMSRIVAGHVRLELQLADPVSFIRTAIESAQPAASARQVGIRFVNACGAADRVWGDPARLQQVMSNLLSNAIKFTPEGGEVVVELNRAGEQIEITVSDTGIGIRADFLPHVFDRFRQADASTTRRHGGLGIGLSIVRQLVELHGGSVSAASPGEGRGATLVVSLPVAGASRPDRTGSPEALARAAVAGTAAEAVDFSAFRILVVDDDADARHLVTRILAQYGAHVIGASSAIEALALLTRDTPNLLVSDVGMPDVDGFELIRRVRKLGNGVAQMPAIALTAFARREDGARAIAAGFTAYVRKPIDVRNLISAVDAVMAGWARKLKVRESSAGPADIRQD
ncbi:hybrid sensor histidine kinase/response regulator [Lacisediminimonas profundi]|uniref:hybrid sensor histidine kinase/response regulator n=1 Tax=Lacisediminimonas profundi TaxID=2603856 RepID=UPI00124AE603|nr:MHYT domain-containing protein [Lacisediminimonas profundi]